MWGPAPATPENYTATSDTIEGLAEQIGVPTDNLKAAVERRNALAAIGEDIDFGLEPHRVTSITQPPYLVGDL
jgi:hypothetical protein